MTSTVFVIADLHFGHGKVAAARGFATTDAHDKALVDAWNQRVSKRDVVYVLGDVLSTDWIADLKGTKKLVMGNHDQRPMSAYAGFSKIFGCYEFDGCILTHIPVHPNQFGRYRLNVHGHTHTHMLDDARYVPTSVEHCPGFAPMVLRDLIRAKGVA